MVVQCSYSPQENICTGTDPATELFGTDLPNRRPSASVSATFADCHFTERGDRGPHGAIRGDIRFIDKYRFLIRQERKQSTWFGVTGYRELLFCFWWFAVTVILKEHQQKASATETE